MKREDLHQVRNIQKEIRIYEKELAKMRAKSHISSQQVSGLPMAAGNSDPTVKRAIGEIELEELINTEKERAELSKANIMRFINTIDNSQIRQIVFLRFIKLNSWRQVSVEIGGNNTSDSCRMMCNRYLDEIFTKK